MAERDILIRATQLLATCFRCPNFPHKTKINPISTEQTQNNNFKMYFSTSILSLLFTMGAVAASVRGVAGPRTLSQVTTLSNSNGSNDEVCFQGFVNTAEEHLTELLINQLLGKSTSDQSSKFAGFPKVSQAVSGVPDYLVGCSIFDFKCMECSLCKDVYDALVETGSEAACDAACVAIVEMAGGGPEDRKFTHPCRLSVKRVRSLSTEIRSHVTHHVRLCGFAAFFVFCLFAGCSHCGRGGGGVLPTVCSHL